MNAHERVYRRLLWLYPAAFRARFAEPMAQLFADQLRDARDEGAAVGSLRLWVKTALDLSTSAVSEHLERNRTVAHSAVSVPTFSARALGIAGVLGGLVLFAPFAITFEEAWFGPHILLFNVLVIALVVGLHRRQAAKSPTLAVAASALVVAADAWYLATVALGMADLNPIGAQFGFVMFLAGIALWASAAAYGVASLAIGAFSRWGPMLLAVGSMLAITGIDRLGLTTSANETIFGPISQIGLLMHGLGWILLGAELAVRAPARDFTAP